MVCVCLRRRSLCNMWSVGVLLEVVFMQAHLTDMTAIGIGT